MDIQAIIFGVMLLYVLLLGLFTALPARKHHWVMALVRTGIIIVSAVVAVPLSKLIATTVGDFVYPMVEGMLGEDVGDLMSHAPVLQESVKLLAVLLVVPVVFFVLFVIIRGILSIVAMIVDRCVPAFKEYRKNYKNKVRSKKNTAIAMPVGAFNGILVGFITLVPLCGYIMFGASVMNTLPVDDLTGGDEAVVQNTAYPTYDVLSDGTDSDLPPIVADILNTDFSKNPMVAAVNGVGMPLFDWMTTENVTGSEGEIPFSLTKEVPQTIGAVMQVGDAFALIQDGNVTDQDKEELLGAVDNLMSSDWLSEVMAQSISYIAGQWKEGQDFMGLAAPDMGETMQPVMNKMWEILSTEDGDTLRQDIKTVTNVLAELMNLGFVGGDGADTAQLLSQLGEGGVLTNVLNMLGENPHMASLADELRATGVRLVSTMMGEALKETDQYDGVLEDVASALNDVLEMPVEERREVLQTSISEAFAQQEIDVPTDVAVEMAEKMIADMTEAGTEINKDTLKDYFVNNMDDILAEGGDDLGDINPDDFGDIDPDDFLNGMA